MSPECTLRFPDDNPGWTYYVEANGDDTPLPAQGEVTLPAGATLSLQAKGGLDALPAVPVERLGLLTAIEVGAGDLGVLKQYGGLTSLVLHGDFTDADVEEISQVLQGVTFLVLASEALTGTCFAQLTPHPEAAVSVWGSGLSDAGLSALLQLPAGWIRTSAPRLSPELLASTSEIATRDAVIGLGEVAPEARADLVDLVARSPRLTSLNLVSQQEDGSALLDDETVLEMRRRRPDLTINGSWLDAEAVDRLSSPASPALAIDETAVAAEPVRLTPENFDQLMAGSTPVLVDFMAEWCGPCRLLAPALHEITGELAGQLVVGTLDIDEQKAIAERYEVSAIPALLLFRDGELVARIGGRDKQAMYAELAAIL